MLHVNYNVKGTYLKNQTRAKICLAICDAHWWVKSTIQVREVCGCWDTCWMHVTKLVFEICAARWLQCEWNMSKKPGTRWNWVFEICSARSRQWQDVVLRYIAPWVQCKKNHGKIGLWDIRRMLTVLWRERISKTRHATKLVLEIRSARSRQWKDVVFRCIPPWVRCKKVAFGIGLWDRFCMLTTMWREHLRNQARDICFGNMWRMSIGEIYNLSQQKAVCLQSMVFEICAEHVMKLVFGWLYYRSHLWHTVSSVCRLCHIVAKRYILSNKKPS